MGELKPCPFCGGTEDLEADWSSECDENCTTYYYAACFSAKCEARPLCKSYVSVAEAIKAWNTRA